MVEKITKWLYLEPLLFKDWVHLAEISKKISKNHSVARQYLNYFEKKGIIMKQNIGRMTMYKLNMKYPLIVDIISLVEKERLIDKSRDILLKEFLGFVHGNFNNCLLIFGSFVENPETAKDIDLLALGNIDKNKFKEIERKLNRKIHLININKLNEVSDALKEEVRKKHLIIQGVEEIVKWLI